MTERERVIAFTITPIAFTPHGSSKCLALNDTGEIIGARFWEDRDRDNRVDLFVWRANRLMRSKSVTNFDDYTEPSLGFVALNQHGVILLRQSNEGKNESVLSFWDTRTGDFRPAPHFVADKLPHFMEEDASAIALNKLRDLKEESVPYLQVTAFQEDNAFAGIWRTRWETTLFVNNNGKTAQRSLGDKRVWSPLKMNQQGMLVGSIAEPYVRGMRESNARLFRCFLRDGWLSAPEYLPDPPNCASCSIMALNDRGDMIGSTETREQYETLYRAGAFAYIQGSFSALPPLDIDSAGRPLSIFALALNNRRQITGYGEVRDRRWSWNHFFHPDAEGPIDHRAFLYENGQMINLNDQIPGDSGWVLEQAVAINTHGAIIGNGTFHGIPCGFLLERK